MADPTLHQNMTLTRGIKFPVSDEMIAYAPCTWELRVSSMENRIPKTITALIALTAVLFVQTVALSRYFYYNTVENPDP